ncbi:MAG: trans-sialidase, partial [Thaumarchaeota archaeon]|nr:trans-sialidase [Nitrososphaerota archaeon]
DAYMNAPMTDFHQYRAKVTGYTPAANRYFVRRTAPVGKVPTSNWNEQKSKVPGYTQPSNQYFATRARLAYSPPAKTFGGFSGERMTVEGVQLQQRAPDAAESKPEPKPAKGKLPKGTNQTQQQQAPPPPSQSSASEQASRKEQLEAYEKNYLERMEQDRIESEKAYQALLAEEAKVKDTQTSSKRGSLPKGFEAKPEPEPPKKSKGTLPKGF